MSDPSEQDKANPHPASSHRPPSEIAKDEEGPIGDHRKQSTPVSADNGPVEKVDEAKRPDPGPPRDKRG